MEDQDDDSDSSNDVVSIKTEPNSEYAGQNDTLQESRNTFKIVQTIENGKLKLWTVPKTWENGGLLRWPRTKVGKLRRNPLSKPTDSWQIINCILIKSDLVSFEFAETVLKFMEDSSDVEDITETPINGDQIQPLRSDVEDITETPIDNDQIHPLRSYKSTQNYIDNHTPKQATPAKSVAPTEHEPEMEDYANILIIPAQNHGSNRFQPKKIVLKAAITSDTSATTQHTEISSKIDSLFSIVSTIAKDQQILVKNQAILLNKMSILTKKFEIYSKQQSSHPFVPFIHDNTQKYMHTREIKPIVDVRDMNELEESLKDENTAAMLRETYSVVCSHGEGKGITNAYMLTDVMFDRHFLTQCSWTGGSRSEDPKVCFKSYKNVINFFFQLVYATDKQFTRAACYIFLKTILRNSTKRAQMKRMRMSTGRCSRKRLRNTIKDVIENGEILASKNRVDKTEDPNSDKQN